MRFIGDGCKRTIFLILIFIFIFIFIFYFFPLFPLPFPSLFYESFIRLLTICKMTYIDVIVSYYRDLIVIEGERKGKGNHSITPGVLVACVAVTRV